MWLSTMPRFEKWLSYQPPQIPLTDTMTHLETAGLGQKHVISKT